MMKVWIVAFLLVCTWKDARSECVGCLPLPVVALALDAVTTSIVWGVGEMSGGDGSFWKTYWTGLAVGTCGAILTSYSYNSADKYGDTALGLLLGMPVGNILGYVLFKKKPEEAVTMMISHQGAYLRLRF